MIKKFSAVLLVLVLIITAFAGCGSKETTTPEMMAKIEASGFPKELLIDGVELNYDEENKVVYFTTTQKSFKEIEAFYRKQIEEKGFETLADYDTDFIVESKGIDPSYKDLGLQSWIYNGVDENDYSFLINVEQAPFQTKIISSVFLSYALDENVNHDHDADGLDDHTGEEVAAETTTGVQEISPEVTAESTNAQAVAPEVEVVEETADTQAK